MEQHPFPPFIDKNSKVLILGSFPSFASQKEGFYYGHPQNQFWKILAKLFDEKEPKNIEEKKEFLQRHRIALWDMVAGCERETSLDSALKNIKVNDIASLMKKFPNIEAIFFTGRKSQQLYEKNFNKVIDRPLFYLPSPSPAYRKMGLQEKVKQWGVLKNFIN